MDVTLVASAMDVAAAVVVLAVIGPTKGPPLVCVGNVAARSAASS